MMSIKGVKNIINGGFELGFKNKSFLPTQKLHTRFLPKDQISTNVLVTGMMNSIILRPSF